MHALILFKKFLTWAGVGREFLFQSCAIIKKNRQIIIKLKRKLKKNLLIYSQITKDTFPLVVREREKKNKFVRVKFSTYMYFCYTCRYK